MNDNLWHLLLKYFHLIVRKLTKLTLLFTLFSVLNKQLNCDHDIANLWALVRWGDGSYERVCHHQHRQHDKRKVADTQFNDFMSFVEKNERTDQKIRTSSYTAQLKLSKATHLHSFHRKNSKKKKNKQKNHVKFLC